MTPSRPPVHGFAIVLLGASLFGTLGPVSRFVYDLGMEPIPFVAWRALIGLTAVTLFVAWRLRRGTARLVRPSDLDRRERTTLGIAALCGAGLNIAMFIAFARISIALALLVFYTYPAMVAALDIASGREVLDRSKWFALALALGGMVAVVASQLDPSGGIALDGIGVALALGAAICQTIFVTVSRDGYRRVPVDQATMVVIGAAFLTTFLLVLVAGAGASMALPLRQPDLWPWLLFAGLFASALPSLCFLIGIRVIGGMRSGIVMLFEPVVGVALAAVLLNEALQPIQLLGGGAILLAALILQRTSPLGDTVAAAMNDAGDGGHRAESEAFAMRVPGGP